ncbi:MAG: chalcone isomerase family protein [Candidatus Latescibacterota bacterium]
MFTRLVPIAVVLVLLAVFPSICPAKEFKGVNFPDTESIGSTTVKLTGIGLRKKLVINVYLGALYQETASSDAAQVISADKPKRVVLHFLYNNVGKEDLLNAWDEGFKNNNPAARVTALKSQIDTFKGYFTEPVKSGEKIIITYVPGKGTEVSIKGAVKGTIPGQDFMEALFSVWLGPKPPSGDLKKGMLGGK